MKRLLLLLCVVGTLLSYSCASENEYYSYDYLKNDYEQVAVVAAVDVQEVKAVGSMGDKEAGYVRYLIRCQVIEPFKLTQGRGRIELRQPVVPAQGEVAGKARILAELLGG